MKRNSNTRYRTIRQALEHGVVRSYSGETSCFGKRMVSFNVRYFKPFMRRKGWSVTAEWYECTESYFERFVRNHRNFR